MIKLSADIIKYLRSAGSEIGKEVAQKPVWTPMHSAARRLVRQIRKGGGTLKRSRNLESGANADITVVGPRKGLVYHRSAIYNIGKANPIFSLFHEVGHTRGNVYSGNNPVDAAPAIQARNILQTELSANETARFEIEKLISKKHMPEVISQYNKAMAPNYSSYKISAARTSLPLSFKGIDAVSNALGKLNNMTANSAVDAIKRTRTINNLLKRVDPLYHRQIRDINQSLIPLMRKQSELNR
jgi:hypothetical protein